MTESVEIPLTQGLLAIVDRDDLEAVLAAGPWHASDNGSGTIYAATYLNGERIRMHKFLTCWPYTDHINGDPLDNRRANLRQATPLQNVGNSKLSRRNTSGYKGVSWWEHKKRWKAYIAHDRRQKHLGYFDTPEEAARAYDAAAREKWGEFAWLNFPDEAGAA